MLKKLIDFNFSQYLFITLQIVTLKCWPKFTILPIVRSIYFHFECRKSLTHYSRHLQTKNGLLRRVYDVCKNGAFCLMADWRTSRKESKGCFQLRLKESKQRLKRTCMKIGMNLMKSVNTIIQNECILIKVKYSVLTLGSKIKNTDQLHLKQWK